MPGIAVALVSISPQLDVHASVVRRLTKGLRRVHCSAETAMRSRNSLRSRCSNRLTLMHDFATDTARVRRGSRRGSGRSRAEDVDAQRLGAVHDRHGERVTLANQGALTRTARETAATTAEFASVRGASGTAVRRLLQRSRRRTRVTRPAQHVQL